MCAEFAGHLMPVKRVTVAEEATDLQIRTVWLSRCGGWLMLQVWCMWLCAVEFKFGQLMLRNFGDWFGATVFSSLGHWVSAAVFNVKIGQKTRVFNRDQLVITSQNFSAFCPFVSY